MELDFDQDIAPMRREYFPTQMRARDFDRSMKFRSEVLMPMRQQTVKLQQQAIQMQNSKLQQEGLMLNLQQTRKKIADDVKAAEGIPELMDTLTGIIEDPSKDNYEKNKAIALVQTSLPPFMLKNPSVSNAFGFAGTAISNNMARLKEEERKKKEEENRRLGIASGFAQIGATDAVRDVVGDSEIGEAYISMAEAYQERNKEAQRTNRQAAAMEDRDKQISEFSKIETKVLGFAPEALKTDWPNTAVPVQGRTVPINDLTKDIEKSGKKWSADEVIKLRTYYTQIMEMSGYSVDPKKLEGTEPNALLKATLSKVIERKRSLGAYGPPPESSVTALYGG